MLRLFDLAQGRPCDFTQSMPLEVAESGQTRHELKMFNHFKPLAVCEVLEG